MADIYAISLLMKLSLKGSTVVEFDSAELAQATISSLKGVAPFPFSVRTTKKGFIRFEKLEVIL